MIVYSKGYKRNIFELKNKHRISFVPTMGSLHQGHLSLIDIAKNNSDRVLVSIFVNPTQFGKNEDFDTYPRDLNSDIDKLNSKKVDFLYLPSVEEVYPNGLNQSYSTGRLGKILEGESRPHFFDGVAQVVSRLFEIINPDLAVFGQKDYQQLAVIKQMTCNLNLSTQIVAAPITREDDGLAMSSRNIYLNDYQRSVSANLYKALNLVKEEIIKSNQIDSSLKMGKDFLLDSGFDKVDYLKLCNCDTLEEISDKSFKDAQLLCASYLGSTRLIDNISISKS